MQVHYICHACLLIDTGELKIVTDPWVYGPAYCGQWNVFPKPVNPELLNQADVVLVTHGHEDHLHDATLRQMPSRAKIFYPYNWYGGTGYYLRELGFESVTEALTGTTYRLGQNTRVTYIANNLDSIVVLESGDQVFVDVNDALHAYPERVIDIFVEQIRSRWPRIDTVFCGFGGAYYFPNAVHMQGKDDVGIGTIREQLFVHNFCRIVNRLKPRRALPFAADFALLRPQQQWINQLRFPRARIGDYFHEIYGGDSGIEVLDMYSADVLTDRGIVPASPYRSKMDDGGLTQLLQAQYADEIASSTKTAFISSAEADQLATELLANLELRSRLFDRQLLRRVNFCLRVSDVHENNCFNISFTSGQPELMRAEARSASAFLTAEIPSRILRYSFSSEWGGDAITIGYGCEVQIHDPKCLDDKLDVICIRLLTRHPQATGHWKKEPVRMTRFLLSSPTTRAWALKAALRPGNDPARRKMHDFNILTGSHWLRRTKCEVCNICDLPLLDEDFAAKV